MNDEPQLPLLHVSEDAWGEIAPSAADVHVTLTSDRFFSGAAALAKAEELRALVTAVTARAIPESAVSLEGVTLDVSSGVFSRSSSATYRVRIHLADTSKLPDVLDAVSGAKKAILSHVAWDYSGSKTPDSLLTSCAERAAAKARALGAALGVTLTRLHRVEEEELGDAAQAMTAGGYGAPKGGMFRMRSSIASELSGLDLTPTKKVGARVKLAYVVGAAT